MISLNLAQVSFDPNASATYRLLGDPYQLHRFVYGVCSASEDPGRVLYRLEPAGQRSVPCASVLVQTQHSVPMEQDKAASIEGHIETKKVRIELQMQRRYRFRVRVNPVKSLPSGQHGKRGKRVGIYDEAEQREWFAARMESHGMLIVSTDHRRESWLQLRRPDGAGGSKVLTFSSAFFEGVMEVTAPVGAEKAVVEGIGPAKGFGFGLLSLAPGG